MRTSTLTTLVELSILALLILAPVAVVDADVIVSNFGPGDTYANGGGINDLTTLPLPFGLPNNLLGVGFTSTGALQLDSASLAVSLLPGISDLSQNELDVSIRQNGVIPSVLGPINVPATAIATTHLSGALQSLGAVKPPPIVVGAFPVPVFLLPGTQYWLTISTVPYNPVGWSNGLLSSPGPQAFSTTSGINGSGLNVGTGAPQLAFSISGTPIAGNRSALQASLLQEIRTLFLDVPTLGTDTTLANKFLQDQITCLANPSCDVGALHNSQNQQLVTGANDTIRAGVSIHNLFQSLGLDPNPIPTSLWDIGKITQLIQWGRDALNILLGPTGTPQQANSATISTETSLVGDISISGTLTSFDTGSMQIDLINAEITAQIAKSQLDTFVPGAQFFNDILLLGSGQAFGIGTIVSVVDPPEFGSVTIALQQIELSPTAAVPLPSSSVLITAGIAVLIGLRWRSRGPRS